MRPLQYIFILSLAIAPFRFVLSNGNEGVGGGSGVLCEHKGKQSIYLAEFYEAELIYDFQPNFPLNSQRVNLNQNGTFDVKGPFFSLIRKRLIEVLGDPESVDFILQPASKMLFIKKKDLHPRLQPLPDQTADVGKIPLGPDCKLIAIASQKKSFGWSDFSHLIYVNSIYDALHMEHQLGLILHETLHSWFYGNQDTTALRQTVIYLSAPKLFRERNKDVIRKVILNRVAADPKEFLTAY